MTIHAYPQPPEHKPQMHISDEIKNQILDIIFKQLDKNETTVFLFGSYAQGTAKQYSDIDVGFISCISVPTVTRLQIQDELNETVRTLRKIDLVDFGSNLDENFKKIALERIELWYKSEKSPKITSSM